MFAESLLHAKNVLEQQMRNKPRPEAPLCVAHDDLLKHLVKNPAGAPTLPQALPANRTSVPRPAALLRGLYFCALQPVAGSKSLLFPQRSRSTYEVIGFVSVLTGQLRICQFDFKKLLNNLDCLCCNA